MFHSRTTDKEVCDLRIFQGRDHGDLVCLCKLRWDFYPRIDG